MSTIWKPFPKQEFALTRWEFEILFGGSRGPGKTDCGLVWLIGEEYEPGKPLLMHPRYRALVIRKNADDLADWIDRAHRFYSGFGVDIAYKPAILRFPSGAIIRTGHLKDDQSYTKYQGQEFPRMLIEELTQIPQEKRYLQLIASCRSTIPEIKPQIFSTTNPGGVGHAWVKRRFVDPAPPETTFRDKTSGRARIFIPAKVDDNPILQKIDPDYVKGLDALKDTDVELWKAWRLGDWNTFAGQFFKGYSRDKHVLKPFTPKGGDRVKLVAGLDWGRVAPFSFHVSALYEKKFIDNDNTDYTFMRKITFQEVYGTEKTPGEWAEIIKRKVDLDELSWIMCDNQIFTPMNDNSMSIFEQFCKADPRFRLLMRPATKDRVGGWENMQNWLSIAPDGLPYWMITENCINLIKEIPDAIHDEDKPEDLTAEFDHALDDQRYDFSNIKWIDAKLGAIIRRGEFDKTHKTIPTAPLSINLDDFEIEEKKEGDWLTV